MLGLRARPRRGYPLEKKMQALVGEAVDLGCLEKMKNVNIQENELIPAFPRFASLLSSSLSLIVFSFSIRL